MMKEDEHVSDYADGGVAKTSSPPAVKISREIAATAVVITLILAVTGSLTAALIVGKMEPAVFAVLIASLMSSVISGYFGRSKPEGVVGEQTLLNLLKR
jgi:hypothetical protein